MFRCYVILNITVSGIFLRFFFFFFLILVNETRISLVDLVEGRECDIRNGIKLHWTSILNTKTQNGTKQTSAVLYYLRI